MSGLPGGRWPSRFLLKCSVGKSIIPLDGRALSCDWRLRLRQLLWASLSVPIHPFHESVPRPRLCWILCWEMRTQRWRQMFPAFKECVCLVEMQPANQDIDRHECGTEEEVCHPPWRKWLEKGWVGDRWAPKGEGHASQLVCKSRSQQLSSSQEMAFHGFLLLHVSFVAVCFCFVLPFRG